MCRNRGWQVLFAFLTQHDIWINKLWYCWFQKHVQLACSYFLFILVYSSCMQWTFLSQYKFIFQFQLMFNGFWVKARCMQHHLTHQQEETIIIINIIIILSIIPIILVLLLLLFTLKALSHFCSCYAGWLDILITY